MQDYDVNYSRYESGPDGLICAVKRACVGVLAFGQGRLDRRIIIAIYILPILWGWSSATVSLPKTLTTRSQACAWHGKLVKQAQFGERMAGSTDFKPRFSFREV